MPKNRDKRFISSQCGDCIQRETGDFAKGEVGKVLVATPTTFAGQGEKKEQKFLQVLNGSQSAAG